jgi:hypothetical protein
VTAVSPAPANIYEVLDAAATPSDDGWIEWAGGECPVDPDTKVQTQYRNGRLGFPKPARSKAIDWHHAHDGSGWDLVAYRVIGGAK